MYKVIYGTEPFGSYADLYRRFLFIYWPAAYMSSTSNTAGKEQADKWRLQYKIPDNRVKKRNV